MCNQNIVTLKHRPKIKYTYLINYLQDFVTNFETAFEIQKAFS